MLKLSGLRAIHREFMNSYLNGGQANRIAMAEQNSTLFLVSGKIAAGKSTMAVNLAKQHSAVLVSEDHWLSSLYPGEIETIEDYVRCSARIRDALHPHIVHLLQMSQSIVMDFPANTLSQRKWLRGIFEAANAAHELHFIDAPDDVCKERLRQRYLTGEHPFQTSEADFELITSHFVAPSPDEGFNVVVHRFE